MVSGVDDSVSFTSENNRQGGKNSVGGGGENNSGFGAVNGGSAIAATALR